MATRRNMLKGLVASGASLGLGAIGLTAAQPAFADNSDSASLPWYQQKLAGTREATAAERATLTTVLQAAAVDEGYASTAVQGAIAQATMSVSPRGTKVGKCAIVLDDNSLFVVTKEFGAKQYDREANQSFWTDGKTVLRDVVPRLHAQSLAAGDGANDQVMAAAMNCCTPTGAALGTCCEYDLQGLFECCGPCAFTIPSPIALAACVIAWCAYCNAAHCKTWYHTC